MTTVKSVSCTVTLPSHSDLESWKSGRVRKKLFQGGGIGGGDGRGGGSGNGSGGNGGGGGGGSRVKMVVVLMVGVDSTSDLAF